MRQSDLFALLAAHGFRTSKSLGQNFLIDESVPERVAESAMLTPETHVLEIGPGIGALTRYLCERAGFVTAIELDKRLPDILRERLADCSNYEIVLGDALKLNLAPLMSRGYTDLRVAANLPYNITSPIIAKLLESHLFASITVMVQREFAHRAAASAGTSDYGAFTVFARYHADCELLFDVPPDAFVPRPNVVSTVLRLTPHAPPSEVADERMFFRVVKAAFAQRRKTLVNALTAGFSELSKSEIAEIVEQCGHLPTVRGETFGIPEFARVAELIAERIG
ncbi:MAG: 16S rRNA (adenine(1518)-N(6)/adenine(1519)-N(6))-dimethyltransferase RsmA [Oscillospiraceae bacterium]|jgi:16S rRNA (adenine1518-N6/adenine1519-N6)-dimethyltransferase|nr:16S rRNA (adenine(1518)-N(6)/adenine(1519)-N(6))-dimethyltransferase RsmA [Oscillospiraceae bacterium]